jgi:hypothetical protein
MSMSKGGSVLRLRRSSVRLAARDRTDAAIAKPETSFVRVDELGDQISGNAWRAFSESRPLQQRVCLSCDFIFVVKNPGFPRGFAGCIPGAVGREPQGPPTSRQPGEISLSGHIPVPHSRRCGRDEPLC